ncbi:MAG: hypothetical protein HYU99_11465 [Deltaproteobacteria bacterium]|nr:hypothetical protein [Deltaproteobacteria bacterium]
MRVEGLTSAGTHLILRGIPTIRTGGTVDEASQKTLGETPPVVLSLEEIGVLASLFAPSGLISRLKKRLNYLKRKKCRVVPAKGTTACIDDDDIVYVGVDFLSRHLDDEETIAGVLAHEWGHACALKPTRDEIQQLNWDQIFELRRAHETLADEISGRLLCRMGYTPEGIVKFLTREKGETHNYKYHAPEIRAQVIRYGYEAEKRKAALARQLFPKSGLTREYDSILLDIA